MFLSASERERRVRVLCDDGNYVVAKWARIEREVITGTVIRYRWGKEDRIVVCPPEYSYRRYDGCKYVRVNVTDAVAEPWRGVGHAYDAENWSSLWVHGLDVRQAKALSGGGGLDWKWIVAIGAVLAVVAVGYMILRPGSAGTPSQTSPGAPGSPSSVEVGGRDGW